MPKAVVSVLRLSSGREGLLAAGVSSGVGRISRWLIDAIGLLRRLGDGWMVGVGFVDLVGWSGDRETYDVLWRALGFAPPPAILGSGLRVFEGV